jgi:hypothetical protein
MMTKRGTVITTAASTALTAQLRRLTLTSTSSFAIFSAFRRTVLSLFKVLPMPVLCYSLRSSDTVLVEFTEPYQNASWLPDWP